MQTNIDRLIQIRLRRANIQLNAKTSSRVAAMLVERLKIADVLSQITDEALYQISREEKKLKKAPSA